MQIPVSDRNEDLTRRIIIIFARNLIKSAEFHLFFINGPRFISRRSTNPIKSDEMDPRNTENYVRAGSLCRFNVSIIELFVSLLSIFARSSANSCTRFPVYGVHLINVHDILYEARFIRESIHSRPPLLPFSPWIISQLLDRGF